MSYWGRSIIVDADGNVKLISYGPNGGTAKLWSAGSISSLSRFAIDIGPEEEGAQLLNAAAWIRPDVPPGNQVNTALELFTSPDVTDNDTNRLRLWTRTDEVRIYSSRQNGQKPGADILLFTYGNDQIRLLENGDLVLCGKTTFKKNGNLLLNGGSERNYLIKDAGYIIENTDPSLIYFSPSVPGERLYLPVSPTTGLCQTIRVPTLAEKGFLSGNGNQIDDSPEIELKSGSTVKVHYTPEYHWTVVYERNK